MTFSISNAQTTNLIGSWEIVEFAIISNENSDKRTEDQLKKDGTVWNLYFMDEGKFEQTSNMSGTGTLDTQEGSWNTMEDNLTIELQINGQKINLNYTYVLNEDILVLSRSNPMGTMKIVSKFKKQ